MTNEQFEASIAQCLAKIDALPPHQRGELLDRVAETRARRESISKSMRGARDALDDWRLTLKYRVFDREAAAREAAEGSTDIEGDLAA